MIEAAVWVTPTERLKVNNLKHLQKKYDKYGFACTKNVFCVQNKVLQQKEIKNANPKFTNMRGAVSVVLKEQGPKGLMVISTTHETQNKICKLHQKRF